MKSSSKLMPEENVFETGEQWEVELPGFGKMTVRLQIFVCLFVLLLRLCNLFLFPHSTPFKSIVWRICSGTICCSALVQTMSLLPFDQNLSQLYPNTFHKTNLFQIYTE